MAPIFKFLFSAILRSPATTDAITAALTKTVTKLETHAGTTTAKADDALAKAAELAATAAKMKEDAEKAAIVAKNLGALFNK